MRFEAGEKDIFRIFFHARLVAARRLAIGGGHQDEFVKLFGRFVAQKLAGEKIEKLRMRRRRTLNAKITRRGDDSAAEVIVPDAIDKDAGNEGILRADQPIGEC